VKPVCVPCQRFYRVTKTGFYFEEMAPKHNGRPHPGTEAPGEWEPYKLWAGDLYECEGCGSQIVVGVGHSPLAEHYENDYTGKLARFGATLQVNDC